MPPQAPIASGRTATIWAAPRGRILKLCAEGFGPDEPQREARAARWARQCGLPVPAPGRVVVRETPTGFRYGHYQTRIEGQNGIARIMAGKVDFLGEAEDLVHRQVAVWAHPGGRLESRRQRIARRIVALDMLTESERQRLLMILEGLPEGDCLLHGDFHPGNLIHGADQVWIVDWIDAARGVPAADVARCLVLFGEDLIGPLPTEDPIVTDHRRQYRERYLSTIHGLPMAATERLDDWVLVTSAARLLDPIPEERDLRLAWVKCQLRCR